MGLGMAHNIQVKGEKLGRGLLPHRAFWADVVALVRDGTAFVKSGGDSSRGRRDVGRGAAGAGSGDGARKAGKKGKHSARQKHSKLSEHQSGQALDRKTVISNFPALTCNGFCNGF